MNRKILVCTLGALALGAGVTVAQKAENKPAAAKPAAKAKRPVRPTPTSDGGQHDDGKGITKLTGNVVVRQDGEDFVLHADNVTYNGDTNQAVATGNLLVETKDSTITGLSLRADFDTKHIVITRNVVMNSHGKSNSTKKPIRRGPGDTVGDITHKPSKMECNVIDFNYDIREALVTGNIRLTQEKSKGTCRQITFDEENNVAELTGDVLFTDKKGQTFQVDRLIVWFDADKLDFKGPVTLKGREEGEGDAPDPNKKPVTPEKKKTFGAPPVVPDIEAEPAEETTPATPAQTKPAETSTDKPLVNSPDKKAN